MCFLPAILVNIYVLYSVESSHIYAQVEKSVVEFCFPIYMFAVYISISIMYTFCDCARESLLHFKFNNALFCTNYIAHARAHIILYTSRTYKSKNYCYKSSKG